MMKPKIFIDEHNNITVVFPKAVDRDNCNVTLVHDRGTAIIKQTNIFGGKLARFAYHCATAYGDSGHVSYTNAFITKGTQYKLIKKVNDEN